MYEPSSDHFKTFQFSVHVFGRPYSTEAVEWLMYYKVCKRWSIDKGNLK